MENLSWPWQKTTHGVQYICCVKLINSKLYMNVWGCFFWIITMHSFLNHRTGHFRLHANHQKCSMFLYKNCWNKIYFEVVVRITDAQAKSVENMFSMNCKNSPRLKPLRKCTAFTWDWYSSIFIFKQRATWKYWRSITNENKTILKVDRCPRKNHAFFNVLTKQPIPWNVK